VVLRTYWIKLVFDDKIRYKIVAAIVLGTEKWAYCERKKRVCHAILRNNLFLISPRQQPYVVKYDKIRPLDDWGYPALPLTQARLCPVLAKKWTDPFTINTSNKSRVLCPVLSTDNPVLCTVRYTSSPVLNTSAMLSCISEATQDSVPSWTNNEGPCHILTTI